VEGARGLDVDMRRHHRPIGNGTFFEDHPIQLIHIPDMIGHGQITFTVILMIEQIYF